MNSDRLEPLLHSLPKEKASDGFTAGVMRRVREERHAPAHRPFWLVPAAATLALAIFTGAGTMAWVRAERAEERRLAAMRAEQEELAAEVRQLSELTAQLEPAVYVGSTSHYDYYVGLDSLDVARPAAQPANWQPGL